MKILINFSTPKNPNITFLDRSRNTQKSRCPFSFKPPIIQFVQIFNFINATKYRLHSRKSNTVRKLSVRQREKIVSNRGNSFVFRFLHIYIPTHTLRKYLKEIKIFSDFLQTIIMRMRKKFTKKFCKINQALPSLHILQYLNEKFLPLQCDI